MEKKLADQIKKLGSVLSGLANIVEEIDREESVKETDKHRCACANPPPYSGCHPCPPRVAYLSYQYPYSYPVLVLDQLPPRKQPNDNSEEDNYFSDDSTRPRKEPKKKRNSGSFCDDQPRRQSKNKQEEDNNSDCSCNEEPRKQSTGSGGDHKSASFHNNGTRRQSKNGNKGDNKRGSFYNNYTSNTNYEENKCCCPLCKETDCFNEKRCNCCENESQHTNSNMSHRSNSEGRRSTCSDNRSNNSGNINLPECNCRTDYRRRKTDLHVCCVKCFPD